VPWMHINDIDESELLFGGHQVVVLVKPDLG